MASAPAERMLQLMVTPPGPIDAHLEAFDTQVLYIPPTPDAMAAVAPYLIDSRDQGIARRCRVSRALLPLGGGDAPALVYDHDLVAHGIKPLVIESEPPRDGRRRTEAETVERHRFRAVEYLTHRVIPEYERGVVTTVVMADGHTIRELGDYLAERNPVAHIGRNFLRGKLLPPGTTLWFAGDGMLMRHVTTTGPP